MIPERPDPAVLEDDASIGEGERGRTMCHHHDRHPRAQLAQHEADRPFSFAVECGSALVEEQEGWSSKQAPRNGQSLALAAGQRTSPIPHIVRGFDVLIFEADSVEHLHKGLIAYLFGISVMNATNTLTGTPGARERIMPPTAETSANTTAQTTARTGRCRDRLGHRDVRVR